MSTTIFNLNTILDDLSGNINNLYTEYNIEDISKNLHDISLSIFQTNQKLEQILDLYNTVEQLKNDISSNS